MAEDWKKWRELATQRFSSVFPAGPKGAKKPNAIKQGKLARLLRDGQNNRNLLTSYGADPGLLSALPLYSAAPAGPAAGNGAPVATSISPNIVADITGAIPAPVTVAAVPNKTKKNRVLAYANAKSPAKREYFARYGKNPTAAVLAKLQSRHSKGIPRNNVYAEVNAALAKKGIAPAAAKTAAAAAEAAVNAVAENAAATAVANVLGTATAAPVASVAPTAYRAEPQKRTRKRADGKVPVMTKEQAIAKAREEYFSKYGRFPKLDRLTKLWPRFYYGDSRNNLYASYGPARGNRTVRAPRTTFQNMFPFARPNIRGPSQFALNRAALVGGPLSTIAEVNESNSNSASASPYAPPKTARQILADNAARVKGNFEATLRARPSAIQIAQLVKASRQNAKAGTTTYKNLLQKFKANRKTKKQTSAQKKRCAKACEVCRECEASSPESVAGNVATAMAAYSPEEGLL